jgi:RNase adaptor protein for sRNA GlmZ degradation
VNRIINIALAIALSVTAFGNVSLLRTVQRQSALLKESQQQLQTLLAIDARNQATIHSFQESVAKLDGANKDLLKLVASYETMIRRHLATHNQ